MIWDQYIGDFVFSLGDNGCHVVLVSNVNCKVCKLYDELEDNIHP